MFFFEDFELFNFSRSRRNPLVRSVGVFRLGQPFDPQENFHQGTRVHRQIVRGVHGSTFWKGVI